jgi:ABC-type amino acid transport substrate-binding protein
LAFALLVTLAPAAGLAATPELAVAPEASAAPEVSAAPETSAAPEATTAPTSPAPDVPLRVLAIEIEPFTMRDGDLAVGYAVDLWDEIGHRAGFTWDLAWVNGIDALLGEVSSGQVDAGIGPISMTPQREARLDFTYPYSSGGLGIMVSTREAGPFEPFVDAIAHPGWLVIGLFLAGVIVVSGLATWISRRGRDGWPSDLRHGFHEGAWRSARVFLGGEFEREPTTGLGRLAAMTWIVLGIILTALFTAAVTSNATVNRLQVSIDGPEDLAGERVVTLAGSTSQEWLEVEGLPYQAVTSVEEAGSMLLEGSADAVVFDQLVLRYHATAHGGGGLEVVGPAFDLDPYGFALPEGSPWQERIDAALLSMIHDGTLDRLHTAWFGPTS